MLLRHPSLSDLAEAGLTYPDAGATGRDLPAGYRHVVRSDLVGHGQEAFDRCAAGLMTWRVHRGSGLRVRASHTPVQVDAVVSQLLGTRALGLVAPCRVVYVVDEPHRQGFAYGTLPGHPETGEEAFVVVLRDDGSVTLDITSFSRSATVLSRLGGPLTRLVQARMTDRYVVAARRIVDSAP